MSSSSSSPAEVKPVENDAPEAHQDNDHENDHDERPRQPGNGNGEAIDPTLDPGGVVSAHIEEPLSETREFPPEASSSGAVLPVATTFESDEETAHGDRLIASQEQAQEDDEDEEQADLEDAGSLVIEDDRELATEPATSDAAAEQAADVMTDLGSDEIELREDVAAALDVDSPAVGSNLGALPADDEPRLFESAESATQDADFLRRVVLPPPFPPAGAPAAGAFPAETMTTAESQDRTVISDPPSREVLAAMAPPRAPAAAPTGAPFAGWQSRGSRKLQLAPWQLGGLLMAAAVGGGLVGGLLRPTAPAAAVAPSSAAVVPTPVITPLTPQEEIIPRAPAAATVLPRPEKPGGGGPAGRRTGGCTGPGRPCRRAPVGPGERPARGPARRHPTRGGPAIRRQESGQEGLRRSVRVAGARKNPAAAGCSRRRALAGAARVATVSADDRWLKASARSVDGYGWTP